MGGASLVSFTSSTATVVTSWEGVNGEGVRDRVRAGVETGMAVVIACAPVEASAGAGTVIDFIITAETGVPWTLPGDTFETRILTGPPGPEPERDVAVAKSIPFGIVTNRMGTIFDPEVMAKRPEAELIRVPPAPDEAIVTIDLEERAMEFVPPPAAEFDEIKT